jgi:mRNA deadenylase 3'-5' endonuclease subunit Ccr4
MHLGVVAASLLALDNKRLYRPLTSQDIIMVRRGGKVGYYKHQPVQIPENTWVSRLEFQSVETRNESEAGSDDNKASNQEIAVSNNDAINNKADSSDTINNDTASKSLAITIVSWNVLAQSYLSRSSQSHLPSTSQSVVFSSHERQRCIREVLADITEMSTISGEGVDVVCLQEVDMEAVSQCLRKQGYKGVETPRYDKEQRRRAQAQKSNHNNNNKRNKSKGSSKGSSSNNKKKETSGVTVDADNEDPTEDTTADRPDGCLVYINSERWSIVEHKVIRLDDLASLPPSSTTPTDSTEGEDAENGSKSNDELLNSASTLLGLQKSFLRRNVALLVRIKHNATGRTVVVANTHLFWNPVYEYVKVSYHSDLLQLLLVV